MNLYGNASVLNSPGVLSIIPHTHGNRLSVLMVSASVLNTPAALMISTQCTALTLCRLINGCNQGSKDACGFTDIAMNEGDKFLVDFSFNDLKLYIYGRYRNDTFIPWLHGVDNLVNFKQVLDEHIKSIYLSEY